MNLNNFDFIFYKTQYTNLNNFTNEELIKHYTEIGIHEDKLPCNLEEYDFETYINDYEDLVELNIEEAKIHYCKNGIFENRILRKKDDAKLNILIDHFNKIYNSFNIYFDPEYYKDIHDDLKIFSENQLINHFYCFGYNEKRLFCKPLDTFDHEYYLKKYDDHKSLNDKNESWKHFLYHGIFEGKNINEKFINHKKYKYGLIYVYYNRINEFRNEINLVNFFKNLNKDTEHLIYINGYNTEVNLIEKENVTIIKNKNTFDFESYLLGIQYFENKYSKNIDEIFNYVTFMNCSVTGPFKNNYIEDIINRINETNSVLWSPIITFLPHGAPTQSGPKVPGYYFTINSDYIHLLTDKNDLFIKYKSKYSNTVLGRKKNKFDCIVSGEHSVSSILLNNNLNICSNINENLDYRIKENWKTLQFSADRQPYYFHKISDSLFIKNNWRIDESNRDSLPVKNYETFTLIGYLSYINNYKELDYNFLDISSKGKIHENNLKWNSKQEFYKYFGDSEQLLIFPKFKTNNKKLYYYSFREDNLIDKHSVEAIKSLMYLGYEIILETASEEFLNVDFKNIIKINFKVKYDKRKHYLNSLLLFPCDEINILEEELTQKTEINKKKNKLKSIKKITDEICYSNSKEMFLRYLISLN